MIGLDRVMSVIESRFDHHSARVILAEALKKAGLDSAKQSFIEDDVKALVKAMSGLGSRIEGVVTGLVALGGVSEQVTKVSSAISDVATRVVEEVKVEAAVDTPAEAPAEAPAEGETAEAPAEEEAAPKAKGKKGKK